MTLILAQLDADGTVVMAGDRLIRQGDRTIPSGRAKVWRSEAPGFPILFGAAGELRVADVLGGLTAPRCPDELAGAPAAYVRGVLVPAVDAHIATTLGRATNGRPLGGGELVVALRGFVAVLGSDLSVIDTGDGIASAGSAALAGRVALRALGTLQTPAFRVSHVIATVADVMRGDVGFGVDVLTLDPPPPPVTASDG